MSYTPAYDPNMLPSPKRGKRTPNRGSSAPRQPFSPRAGQYDAFASPRYDNNNSPRSRMPYGNNFRPRYNNSPGPRYNNSPRMQGSGCPYDGYSPRYRSMNTDFAGSSPNCSFEENKAKKNNFRGRGGSNEGSFRDRPVQGLFHRSMLDDPWSTITIENKPLFKATSFVNHNFMSYCAKLQIEHKEKSAKPKHQHVGLLDSALGNDSAIGYNSAGSAIGNDSAGQRSLASNLKPYRLGRFSTTKSTREDSGIEGKLVKSKEENRSEESVEKEVNEEGEKEGGETEKEEEVEKEEKVEKEDEVEKEEPVNEKAENAEEQFSDDGNMMF